MIFNYIIIFNLYTYIIRIRITMSYDNILKTDKPDREIEHFWYTFKGRIIKLLDNDGVYEIQQLSNRLNNLQKNEQYDEIEEYITNHIENIGYLVLQYSDYQEAFYLMTNLKRWSRISKHNLCVDSNLFYCLLKVYISIHKNNQEEIPAKKNIIDSINRYAREKSDIHIINIVNNAIIHNYHNIIDHLRDHINIRDFVNKNEYDDIPLYILKKSKGIKLMKYLKPTLISSQTPIDY